MAFRFNLATVLRLREIAEEREERLLGQIHFQIGQAQQNLVEISAKRDEILRERQLRLEGKMSAAMLQSSYGRVIAIDLAEKQMKEKLAKLESLRMQQMLAYKNAHRNRELLSEMREEQKKSFNAERTLREQKAMDDNFVARMAR